MVGGHSSSTHTLTWPFTPIGCPLAGSYPTRISGSSLTPPGVHSCGIGGASSEPPSHMLNSPEAQLLVASTPASHDMNSPAPQQLSVMPVGDRQGPQVPNSESPRQVVVPSPTPGRRPPGGPPPLPPPPPPPPPRPPPPPPPPPASTAGAA